MKLSRAKPRIIYCTPILASYKLLVFSTVVYTLRNATVTRGRLKLKFSKVLTSILVRKLSKLKVSNSSGSRACILHSYVIYTTKRLHAQRNNQTFRSCSSSSFKMLSQSHEFSSILTGKKYLESLSEDCFSARPVEEEDDHDFKSRGLCSFGPRVSQAVLRK